MAKAKMIEYTNRKGQKCWMTRGTALDLAVMHMRNTIAEGNLWNSEEWEEEVTALKVLGFAVPRD